MGHPGAVSPAGPQGAAVVGGAGEPEHCSHPTPRRFPGWEMKTVNVSLLGRLLAGGGWGRASAFCWSLGLHRWGGWQIHRRTKWKFLLPRWSVLLGAWLGSVQPATVSFPEALGCAGRALAPAAPSPAATNILLRSPLVWHSLSEHPCTKPGAPIPISLLSLPLPLWHLQGTSRLAPLWMSFWRLCVTPAPTKKRGTPEG